MTKLFWNTSEGRLRAFWRVGLFQAVFVTAFWWVGSLLSPLLRKMDSAGPAGMIAEPIFGKAVASLLVLAVLWLAAKFLDRRPLADYGFHFNRRWWKLFGYGTAAGLVLQSVPIFLAILTGHARVVDVFHSPYESITFVVGILVAVPHMLLIGFWEESALRGYSVKNLAEAFSDLPPRIAPLGGVAMLATSGVVFALFHLFNGMHETHRLVFLTMWGMSLAAIFSVHGELAFPIGFHAAADFSVFHLLSIYPKDYCFDLVETKSIPIDFPLWYLLLTLAVMVWVASVTSKTGYRSPLSDYRPSGTDPTT